MVFGRQKIKYSPIAIDFGSDSLKMLQVIPRDRPEVVASALFAIPDGVRQNPGERLAFLEGAVRQGLKEQPFYGKKVMCSLPAYQTLTQNLELSKCHDDAAYLEEIHQELIEKFSVDPSRMVIRWYPMTQLVRDGASKQEVLCMAAGEEIVMGYLDLAKNCKMEVVGIHAEQFAMVKSFGYLFRRESDREAMAANMYIDLGGATTKVTVTHCTDVAFAKTIHLGGNHLTLAYAKKRGLSFADAREERILLAKGKQISAGVVAEPAPLAVGERRDESHAVSGLNQLGMTEVKGEVEEDTLDMIVDELQMCVRFHQHLYPEKSIEKLIFLGGESQHMSTCHKIAKTLRIKAQLGDPLARLDVDSLDRLPEKLGRDRSEPSWAVVMGLCLSEANLG